MFHAETNGKPGARVGHRTLLLFLFWNPPFSSVSTHDGHPRPWRRMPLACADLANTLRDWNHRFWHHLLTRKALTIHTEIELLEIAKTFKMPIREAGGSRSRPRRTQPRLLTFLSARHHYDGPRPSTPRPHQRARTFPCSLPKPAVRRPTMARYAVAVHRDNLFGRHSEPSGDVSLA